MRALLSFVFYILILATVCCHTPRVESTKAASDGSMTKSAKKEHIHAADFHVEKK